MLRPTLQDQIWLLAEKFQEQKRMFPGQQPQDCFFPLMGLRQCFASPLVGLWDGSPFLLRYTCIALEPGLVLEHSSSVDCSKLSAVQQLGSGERSESLM